MSNPFLQQWYICEHDCKVFNKLGMTLVKLGVVDALWMEYDEYEDLEDGCRCGGCRYTTVEAGVGVMVGEAYEEFNLWV